MGTAFAYCVPSSPYRVHLAVRKKRKSNKKMQFNELPRKVLKLILANINQTERQKQRIVCRYWNNFILEEFPVELVITQGNCERLFRCTNAVAAEIQSLSVEYTGKIGFGSTIRTILFTGKVLSSNLFTILRYCPDLETLNFSSLKQVLGIEGIEPVKLPKLTTIGIKVRPDQETFTSDEIIIISVLRQVLFGSLKTISVSTKNVYEDDWDNDDDDDDDDSSRSEESKGFSVSSMTPMPSPNYSTSSGRTASFQIDHSRNEEIGEPGPGTRVATIVEEAPGNNDEPETSRNSAGPADAGTTSQGLQTAGTQTVNTNLRVIINRAANFPNESGSNAATINSSSRASSSSSSRQVRHNLSEFEARLFYANLELLMESTAETTVLNILNESHSRTRIDSSTFIDLPGITAPALKNTVFFEFVRNNHMTMKNLIVKTRSDFTCFGNLSTFMRDLSKVQFEEIDYSFGRMQMCQEHYLLRAQCKLEKLKVQILDDMWKHIMFAVEHCQNTLQEIDVKVLSVSDDTFDITPILGCHKLQILKLLHFYEKESLSRLPRSLTKLVLNGPIKYGDMNSWAENLLELSDLTLLLNVRGDKIDLELYKKFLKMPKMSRLTLIQCPTALDDIQRYYETTLKTQKGIKFWFSGPKDIRDVPAIQYVYTLINSDEFDRSVVRVG